MIIKRKKVCRLDRKLKKGSLVHNKSTGKVGIIFSLEMAQLYVGVLMICSGDVIIYKSIDDIYLDWKIEEGKIEIQNDLISFKKEAEKNDYF